MRGVARAARRGAARELLERIGPGEFGSHFPHQLSGGMQQRVSLARVLIGRTRDMLTSPEFMQRKRAALEFLAAETRSREAPGAA